MLSREKPPKKSKLQALKESRCLWPTVKFPSLSSRRNETDLKAKLHPVITEQEFPECTKTYDKVSKTLSLTMANTGHDQLNYIT